MLRHALKEWAVICRALAAGRQAVLLRKGGIAETAGEFRVEHDRFWLLPTYVHQQRAGIKPEALPLLAEVEADRPPEARLRLDHFAEVARVHHLADASRLASLHLWSEETIQSRFTYRQPGLFLLAVRVYRSDHIHEIADTPHYAGCRSWVELDEELPTGEAQPVLDDGSFLDLLQRLESLLASGM
jgi:hypothetical protein